MAISRLRRYLKEADERTKENYEIGTYSYPEAFLYFADIAKGVVDTFTPYKTPRHRNRDIWQLVYGLQNVFIGILHVPVALFLFLGNIFFDAIPSLFTKGPKAFLLQLGYIGYSFGSSLLGAISQSLRGIIQIVTSPLALARIPLRNFLSRNTPWQKFQERKSIKRLVSEIDSIMAKESSIGQICKALNQLERKVKSNADKKQELTSQTSLPSAWKYYFVDRNAKDDDQISRKNIKAPKLYQCLTAFRLPSEDPLLDAMLIKYLRKNKNELTLPSVDTCLRRASAAGHMDDVIFLVGTGKADLFSTSSKGKTAIDWAKEYHHEEVAAFLESKREDKRHVASLST